MSLTISVALQSAIKEIAKVSDSSQLDAELLLAHVLAVSRSYLYAWPEKIITTEQEDKFKHLLLQRLQLEPIAYLVNHQEFWSLDFYVTPDVLIPRADTELLVELILQKFNPQKEIILADLGTGSGAIALTIAYHRPNWKIHATDQSEKALSVAKKNAERFQVKNVEFHVGHWLQALPDVLFDVIVSNPPYIAENDVHLVNLFCEPRQALVSGVDGLDAIREIVRDAKLKLNKHGCLLVEHGYDQAEKVRQLFHDAKYNEIKSYCDLSGIERVTVGIQNSKRV
jgi:release factor glutamine methyltransferase